ncbi:MAG: hypothetical protein IJ257_06990 [Treponema sp.]|nr:hypothetical protein [Treponema sp.]
MFLFPRTKKQIIEVFRYCCFRGLKAECEGILVLEEDRGNPPLDGIAKEYEKQRPISADENHLVPE